jgi:hypothetical protein
MSVNARSRQSSGSVAIPAYHDFDEQAPNTALDERCLARVLFRLDVLIPRRCHPTRLRFRANGRILVRQLRANFWIGCDCRACSIWIEHTVVLEGIDVHNSHDDDNDHSGDMANLVP